VNDGLKREIRQRRPFGSPAEEALLNLFRTAAVLEAGEARFFRRFELTPTQYNALRILRGARSGTLTCSEVGERMVKPVPDVTRLLDRLQAKGLAFRSRDQRDRRVVKVGISEAGLALLTEIDRPLADWIDERLGHVSDGDLRRLSALLERARAPAEPD